MQVHLENCAYETIDEQMVDTLGENPFKCCFTIELIKEKELIIPKLILCLNISDIAIITVKFIHYRCIIHFVNKSKAISLLEFLFFILFLILLLLFWA